jgi:hypothetical protein
MQILPDRNKISILYGDIAFTNSRFNSVISVSPAILQSTPKAPCFTATRVLNFGDAHMILMKVF